LFPHSDEPNEASRALQDLNQSELTIAVGKRRNLLQAAIAFTPAVINIVSDVASMWVAQSVFEDLSHLEGLSHLENLSVRLLVVHSQALLWIPFVQALFCDSFSQAFGSFQSGFALSTFGSDLSNFQPIFGSLPGTHCFPLPARRCDIRSQAFGHF
jgi:hypothetical protein